MCLEEGWPNGVRWRRGCFCVECVVVEVVFVVCVVVVIVLSMVISCGSLVVCCREHGCCREQGVVVLVAESKDGSGVVVLLSCT